MCLNDLGFNVKSCFLLKVIDVLYEIISKYTLILQHFDEKMGGRRVDFACVEELIRHLVESFWLLLKVIDIKDGFRCWQIILMEIVEEPRGFRSKVGDTS